MMETTDFSKIRQELEQMRNTAETKDFSEFRQELEQLREEVTSPKRHNPVFDFGLFILLYFFVLVMMITIMLAVGVSLMQYTCLYALPFAWLGLFIIRKKPLYTLGITVLGAVFLAACSMLAGQLFDIAWDSNCYHKVDTGMLVYGWNPFRQTLISFANSTDILPYNSGWLSYQVDNQPKASFMIGAAFYALTGNIAYGKIFNLAGMVAAICLVSPLVADAFHLKRFRAFLVVLLACANPISLAQLFTYYNDGFVFQMLTISAASLAYMSFKPKGRYTLFAKASAFMAVCLAVNIKTSAVLFCTVICGFYFITRLIAIAQLNEPRDIRKKKRRTLFLYFVLMAFFGMFVLGATTYVMNWVRYGNPLYGMLGESSINELLEALMSPTILALPHVAQFFVSLFSPMSNELFTEVSLKIPFTFSLTEWNLETLDANVGGWGFLFSGIFLISLAVIIRSLYNLSHRRSRRTKLLVITLFVVFTPVFFIPYLFSARYYLQLFWVPMVALICLLGPHYTRRRRGMPVHPKRDQRITTLGVVLSILLAVNCLTAFNYLRMQISETQTAEDTIAYIQEEIETENMVLDITPMQRGLFYGLVFNLQDEGITEYSWNEDISTIRGNVLYYLAYNLRDRGDDQNEAANSFLYSLNSNEYLVVIAKQGSCGALTTRMISLLSALSLEADLHDSTQDLYLAVIDTNTQILYEEYGTETLLYENTLTYTDDTEDVTLSAQSSAEEVSVIINGTEYSLGQVGYNIVVYDPVNQTLVDTVVINPDNDPSLSR